ncbi:dehydrodolichyl diphosphate synthase 2-like [Olea europaea subsp. europaea]|uniref:Alkyl transferase n=1 Tax=Olea europaea subsp. europaea TaxID=158383 RepID=A0A8S0RTU2_OLEEU|nr:dehydrodolichyl diphosphate synthase 2-like [Olea europaea subsp. europaea]
MSYDFLVWNHRSTTQWEREKASFSGKLSAIKSVHMQEVFPEGLKPELMPKHVAIILDGSLKYFKERSLSVELNHLSGGRVIKKIAFLCDNWGIKILYVFASSTESWDRPKVKYNVHISAIGDKSKLPESLQKLIAKAEETTRGNTGLHLLIAINYSGRYDMMRATKSIAGKVKDGIFQVEDVNEILFEKELETNSVEFPNPDLLIRTSGEQRISNFYLWHLAYTEIFFSKKKFPDFDEEDFIEALSSF